jgi:hypothetical protein
VVIKCTKGRRHESTKGNKEQGEGKIHLLFKHLPFTIEIRARLLITKFKISRQRQRHLPFKHLPFTIENRARLLINNFKISKIQDFNSIISILFLKFWNLEFEMNNE